MTTDPQANRVHVDRVSPAGRTSEPDLLAIEEPLEIRLNFELAGRLAQKSISITMRTPGDDFALAAGFLFSEGIVRKPADIAEIAYCIDPKSDAPNPNIVRVTLSPDTRFDAARLHRNFYTTSSCGVCGKASLEALRTQGCPTLAAGPTISEALIHALPQRLRTAQRCFELTGGLHAAALFTPKAELIAICEDVGRHNALDKLIGQALLAGQSRLDDHILVVSGRTSFEIIQKALMAAISIVVAVGAPSTLAVDLAHEHAMTLLGFVRDQRFNIYNAPERITPCASQP
ncbi:MAG: formate dehydrogenase accessory sulfurtransferase FdhD [Bradymonadaceae bacterium]|nr:formate dehydrogenase accessory sulfurtransferase FdhD [Lujinxingiaceae bacterium]